MKNSINYFRLLFFLLSMFVSLILPFKNGFSQITIHSAAKNGDLDQLNTFINDSTEVNKTDKTGWSPLMYAVRFNHLEIVKVLINHKADVNFRDNNDVTPLMNAARYGYFDIVEFLLNNGADPKIKNKSGSTALTYALAQNQDSIVSLLSKLENENVIVVIDKDPEVLKSPKDAFGIPEKLYAIDSKLLNYKNEIINRKQANQRRGKRWIVFGSVYAGCGLLISALSGGKGNYELTFGGARTGIDVFDFGIFTTVVGLASGLNGIIIKYRTVPTNELKNYYETQYGKYLEVGFKYNF